MILTSMLMTLRRNKVDVLCVSTFPVIAYPACLSFVEYNDDSTIIPRSSSVIVKRMPAARSGKGKASYYASGVTSTAIPTSEPIQRPGSASNVTWHKGSMSKRFDGKEDSHLSFSNTPGTKSATSVRLLPFHRSRFLTSKQQPVLSSNIAKEDEQAAMAAMFQAQTANWEETQEKMSQLVSLFGAFHLCSSTGSNEHFFFVHLSSYLLLCSTFTQSAKNIFKPTRRDWDSARRQA